MREQSNTEVSPQVRRAAELVFRAAAILQQYAQMHRLAAEDPKNNHIIQLGRGKSIYVDYGEPNREKANAYNSLAQRLRQEITATTGLMAPSQNSPRSQR